MWWPVQSPDLNPIEDLWIDVKRDVQNAKQSNTRELWDVIQNISNLCYVEHMQAVLRNKGFTTKYELIIVLRIYFNNIFLHKDFYFFL